MCATRGNIPHAANKSIQFEIISTARVYAPYGVDDCAAACALYNNSVSIDVHLMDFILSKYKATNCAGQEERI